VRHLFFYLFILGVGKIQAQSPFIKTDGIKFTIHNQSYSFIGTNYWYGGYLSADTSNNGYQRLCGELDFLNKQGVTNLRVLFSGEGDSTYPYRIHPSIQEKPMQYNKALLKSFDIFLNEVSKRNMKAVLVLNNNWEWSGGFGQYLEWAGYSNPILPKTPLWDWDKYSSYISQFYDCDSCQIWYRNWIKKIVTRRNTINNKRYIDDEAIMSWQLANEPRPMKPSAIRQYKNWIQTTSEFIKSLDSNHLISIGLEGIIGTSMDTMLFGEIHSMPNIHYATIHLWPKTWHWYNGQTEHATTDTTLEKTKNYIQLHSQICKKIKKPLVIEEFGLHRDANLFSEFSSTINRNKYYKYVFDVGQSNSVSGYNFWGAFALRDKRLNQNFWSKGLPYGADPPQEEQGLYGVFISDTSTWKLIKNFSSEKAGF
jgi:mannan endo-1,4-beta-mannosidase